MALDFTADNSAAIVTPYSPNPGYWHDAFSVKTWMIWFKIGSSTTDKQTLWEEGGTTNGAALIYNTGADTLSFGIGEGSLVQADSTSTYADGEDVWHCAVCIYDNGALSLYVDGVSEGTNTASGSSIAAHSNEPGIGNMVSSTPFGGTVNWEGHLGEFAMWGRALTVAEIVALANGASPARFRSSLQVYHPLYGVHATEPDYAATVAANNATPHASITRSVSHPPVVPYQIYACRATVPLIETGSIDNADLSSSGIASISFAASSDAQASMSSLGIAGSSLIGLADANASIVLSSIASTSLIGVADANASIVLPSVASTSFVATSDANATFASSGLAIPSIVATSDASAIISSDGVASVTFIVLTDASILSSDGLSSVSFAASADAVADMFSSSVSSLSLVGVADANATLLVSSSSVSSFIGLADAIASFSSVGIGFLSASTFADAEAAFNAQGVAVAQFVRLSDGFVYNWFNWSSNVI